MMLSLRRFLLIALGLILSTQVLAVPVPLNKVVALVNDKVITQAELNKQFDLVKKQNSDISQKQVLEQLISDELQLQRAAQMGMEVKEAGLESVIANIAKQNNMSLLQLQAAVIKEGITFEDYKKNIKTQYIISSLREREILNSIEISPKEVDFFLNSTANKPMHNTEYRLGHLLIALPENPTADHLKKAKQEALALLEKSSENTQWEDLGWRKSSELPTLFVTIVPSMNKDEIKGPFQSASGLHVIKLLDKQESQETVSAEQKRQATNMIKNKKAGEKLESWLRQLRDEAYVQIYLGENNALS